ncbi:hypothetical protein ABT168_34035, partial [Streptomyces sp. NPDC001793]
MTDTTSESTTATGTTTDARRAPSTTAPHGPRPDGPAPDSVTPTPAPTVPRPRRSPAVDSTGTSDTPTASYGGPTPSTTRRLLDRVTPMLPNTGGEPARPELERLT